LHGDGFEAGAGDLLKPDREIVLIDTSILIPTLTVYIVKKPCKSLKSSGLQSFFLCYQMCVQIFIF